MAKIGMVRANPWSDVGIGTTPWAALTGSGAGGVPGAGDHIVVTFNLTVDTPQTIGKSLNAGITGTGTVGTSGSSTTLTGNGSAIFLSELEVGDVIAAGANARLITAVASDSSATMGTAANITAGTSFTYTPIAIHMGSTAARLTINADLTIKGGLSVHYASTTPVDLITQANGTIVEFDSSGSPGTTTTKYPIFTMSANNQQWTWKMTSGAGTSQLRSKTGGGAAYFTDGGSVVGAWFDWSNADISRIGDSTNDFARVWLGSTANAKWLFTDVDIDSCGQINSATTPHASSSMQLNGVRITNSQHATYSVQIAGNTNNATTYGIGKAGSKRCYFDKVVKLTNSANVGPIDGAIFAARFETATATTTKARAITDCWIRQSTDTWNIAADVSESVFHYAGSGTNQHWFSAGFTGTGTIDVLRNAFVHESAASDGNHFIIGQSGTAAVYNFEENLFLPNSNGGASGQILAFGGTRTGMVANYRRNTVWLGDSGGFAFEAGHLMTSVPSPNCIGAIESNLFVSNGNNGASNETGGLILWHVGDSTPYPLDDVVTPSAVLNNGAYQIRQTYDAPAGASLTNQGGGWAAKLSTPITSNIDLDASGGPDFVGTYGVLSPLAMWDASLGGPGTVGSAWSNIVAGTTDYTAAGFLAYHRAQATPRNQLLKATGVGGVDVGAVAIGAASGGDEIIGDFDGWAIGPINSGIYC